jgi:hypothetical protein
MSQMKSENRHSGDGVSLNQIGALDFVRNKSFLINSKNNNLNLIDSNVPSSQHRFNDDVISNIPKHNKNTDI